MRIAIRSSREYSRKIELMCRSLFEVEQIYFVEPINYFCGSQNVDSKIISNYCAFELYKDGNIDKFFIPEAIGVRAIKAVKKEMEGFGINPEDVIYVKNSLIEGEGQYFDKKKRDELLVNHLYRSMDYLEFHVVDQCNLNCNNCTHFSPYVDGEVFANLKSVKRDLKRLKELVDGIGEIRIMGGECLLNPDLEGYIKAVRDIYPYSNLHIVTNGIIADHMPDALVQTIKEQGTIVDVSAYPPLFGKIDSLARYFNDKGIRWCISDPIFKFSKIVDVEQTITYPYRSTQGQFGCDCKNLLNGKIAICPTVCYSQYGDKAYGEGVISGLSERGFVDLDKIASYDELMKLINTPCELCNHCLFYRSEYDDSLWENWRPTKKIDIMRD